MKLNLKSRKHELTIGDDKITVRVRPLTILEFQTLLGAISSDSAAFAESTVDVMKIVRALAKDREAGQTVLELLNQVVKLDTQFQVETDEGERAGTLNDLMTGTLGLAVAASLFGYVFNAGALSEVEAKN